MNKQMKQHLESVVDALVEQDTAAAKEAFHSYLRLKSQAILMGEAADESDDEDDEKKDDKKVDKDLKKVDKDLKKAEKDQKKDVEDTEE
jgi:hypothetical protein